MWPLSPSLQFPSSLLPFPCLLFPSPSISLCLRSLGFTLTIGIKLVQSSIEEQAPGWFYIWKAVASGETPGPRVLLTKQRRSRWHVSRWGNKQRSERGRPGRYSTSPYRSHPLMWQRTNYKLTTAWFHVKCQLSAHSPAHDIVYFFNPPFQETKKWSSKRCPNIIKLEKTV